MPQVEQQGSWMRLPTPSNPFAPSRGSDRSQSSELERLATLEANQQHLASGLEHTRQATVQLQTQVHHLVKVQQLGINLVAELPAMVEKHLAAITQRLINLEASWWEPMRPHLWKIYLALGTLAFAKGWKLVTGEALPISTIIIGLLRP